VALPDVLRPVRPLDRPAVERVLEEVDDGEREARVELDRPRRVEPGDAAIGDGVAVEPFQPRAASLGQLDLGARPPLLEAAGVGERRPDLLDRVADARS